MDPNSSALKGTEAGQGAGKRAQKREQQINHPSVALPNARPGN